MKRNQSMGGDANSLRGDPINGPNNTAEKNAAGSSAFGGKRLLWQYLGYAFKLESDVNHHRLVRHNEAVNAVLQKNLQLIAACGNNKN